MKTIRDLVEDVKRRTVLLCIWILGLAYLMTLTSHSVWVNLPIAFLIIAIARSLSSEVQIRWKGGVFPRPPYAPKRSTRYKRGLTKDSRKAAAAGKRSLDLWRLEIAAPEVEAAIEDFTRSIVRDFVTNLWFASVSSDQEFPDELSCLINNVFAELSQRVKRINLISLLTQDIVDLLASHLELFRRTQARVGADTLGVLSAEERDENLKQAMSAAGDLHPALVSTESENRVLHKLMGGLIPLILKRDDEKCKVARSLSRELLACAVMRPVMNLLNPGFVNTHIENASRLYQARAAAQNQARASAASSDTSKASSDTSKSVTKRANEAGVEMVSGASTQDGQAENGGIQRLRSSLSENSLAKLGLKAVEDEGESPLLLLEGPTEGSKKLEGGKVSTGNYGHQTARDSKENWAQLLEVVNQRKTLALTPEHLDNLWAKGRNYKKKDATKPSGKGSDTSVSKDHSNPLPPSMEQVVPRPKSKAEVDGNKKTTEFVELQNSSSLKSDSSTRNTPDPATVPANLSAEPDQKKAPQVVEGDLPPRMRRSRSIGAELDGWQALAHPVDGVPSLLKADDGPGLGPGFDLDLALRKQKRGKGGTDNTSLTIQPICNQLQVDVVGAHFEKGGSKTFAVYSIFVTDLQNRTWEVQRRFRNFEQLHRSLKDQPYYNLSLPAKRFLSSNLDNSFIRQRCALLDKYLKDLLAIPSVAELHEVWDFLSANSQTYAFGESPSMFQTLTSNVDDAVDDMFRQFRGAADTKPVANPSVIEAKKQFMMGNSISPTTSHLPILTSSSGSIRQGVKRLGSQNIWEVEEVDDGIPEHLELGWSPPEHDLQTGPPSTTNTLGSDRVLADVQKDARPSSASKVEAKHERSLSEGHSPVGSLNGSDLVENDNLAIPQDWGPPKVSVPLLNLVDVIFELQGRGWIRRQVFWMAKQVLQLGMGDAIDDFLLDKIQQLRREEVVAGGIRWLHRILWPDGIFLTKHPSRQATANQSSFEQRLEAARRAGIVREIILERAPAGLVSLIGRKQYQRCAKDLFFFLQSAVCLKQLTYSLLEMLLLTAFPELRDLILEARNL